VRALVQAATMPAALVVGHQSSVVGLLRLQNPSHRSFVREAGA